MRWRILANVQNVIWWNPEALLKSDFCMFRFAQIGSFLDWASLSVSIFWTSSGLDALSKAFYETGSIWNTFFESLSRFHAHYLPRGKYQVNYLLTFADLNSNPLAKNVLVKFRKIIWKGKMCCMCHYANCWSDVQFAFSTDRNHVNKKSGWKWTRTWSWMDGCMDLSFLARDIGNFLITQDKIAIKLLERVSSLLWFVLNYINLVSVYFLSGSAL